MMLSILLIFLNLFLNVVPRVTARRAIDRHAQ